MKHQSHKKKAQTCDKLGENNKEFLCFIHLKKGLQRNFKVQGIMINEVQKVICPSLIPIPLNIKTDTILSTTNGSPIAK